MPQTEIQPCRVLCPEVEHGLSEDEQLFPVLIAMGSLIRRPPVAANFKQ